MFNSAKISYQEMDLPAVALDLGAVAVPHDVLLDLLLGLPPLDADDDQEQQDEQNDAGNRYLKICTHLLS